MVILTHQQNTMNEVLRLYPAVPFNVRLALHDTTLPRGGGPDGLSPIGILKDTPIGYTTLGMQRRLDLYPSSWSADPSLSPLNFNPSRWYNWQPKPWTYIPFNGGPRICIGQQFALTEMGYTIVRMLQRFERIVPMGEGGRMGRGMGDHWDGEVVLKAEIVLQPGMGVWVGFWERGVGPDGEGEGVKEKRGLVEV
jgi:cytochrome P450